MVLENSDRHMWRCTCIKARASHRPCTGCRAPDRNSMRLAMGVQCQRQGLVATEVELVKGQTLQRRVIRKQRMPCFIPWLCLGVWQYRCVQHFMHAPQRWCHHQSQCQPPRHPGRAQLVHAGQESHDKVTQQLALCLVAMAHAAVLAQCQALAAGLQLLLAVFVLVALFQTLCGLLVGARHTAVAFDVFQRVLVQLAGCRRCVVMGVRILGMVVVMGKSRCAQRQSGGKDAKQ